MESVAIRKSRLRRLKVFAGTNEHQLQLLAEALEEESVDTGTEVVRQGEPADAFYVVVRGRLDVLVTGGPKARTQKFGELRDGDSFGEIGLLRGLPRTATVKATVPGTLLYRIPAAEFLTVVRQSPAVEERLRSQIEARLSATYRSLRFEGGLPTA